MDNDLRPPGSSADVNSMSDLLDQYLPDCQLQAGQVTHGTVLRITPTEIVIDVGAKCEGTVSGQELARVEPAVLESLEPGDEVAAYILRAESPGTEIRLSLVRAHQEKNWNQAEVLHKSEETVELEVVASNRGGLIVCVGTVRGFVPASQLDPSRCIPRISDPDCSKCLASLVTSRLKLQIIEVDKERNRLILSERAVLAKLQEKEAEQLLKSLRKGEVRTGRVTNLTNFGAFVDLGGLDGLLHLSEMSWYPVGHPSDRLKIGQEIQVKVLNVDSERRQVALSTKRLEPDPWITVGERYEVGQAVEGQITRLTKWGAFARIVGDEAIEGLIHISELSEEPIDHPRDVVQSGEIHPLRILRVEPERHRLGLSLKQAPLKEQALAKWDADYVAPQERQLERSVTSAVNEALQG
jgi:small subunit ribosomal protein S1